MKQGQPKILRRKALSYSLVSWTGKKRDRDRGHELSNFPRTGRVCLARSRRLLALHDSHARNEKPGGASARAAAPPPCPFLVISYGGAQDPALCAHSRARASCRPWGRGRRRRAAPAAPKWGELGLAFRRRSNSGARPFLAPAIAMCRCQADVNASAVVVGV